MKQERFKTSVMDFKYKTIYTLDLDLDLNIYLGHKDGV